MGNVRKPSTQESRRPSGERTPAFKAKHRVILYKGYVKLQRGVIWG
jgi:hypothetical protein